VWGVGRAKTFPTLYNEKKRGSGSHEEKYLFNGLHTGTPEVGERDSARRFQRVLVPRVNDRGDKDAWITGRTNSSDLPLTNPRQATRFAFDIFITEVNATGSDSLSSTFLGGTGSESAAASGRIRWEHTHRGRTHFDGSPGLERRTSYTVLSQVTNIGKVVAGSDGQGIECESSTLVQHY
jgi:hypothetical protein